ncbi:hypothetical protein WR25_27130 [Diploscapter pachys]|uniref:Uncharacterized protein n=1 Tax=Diploscapter pachys TaxID=2018661 RepID=A0A2A2KUK7_9BILA|nr:hypothetical protein WR25_27130 [Diploscapter pachys]
MAKHPDAVELVNCDELKTYPYIDCHNTSPFKMGMKLLLVLSITVICGTAKASEENKALADLTSEGRKAYSSIVQIREEIKKELGKLTDDERLEIESILADEDELELKEQQKKLVNSVIKMSKQMNKISNVMKKNDVEEVDMLDDYSDEEYSDEDEGEGSAEEPEEVGEGKGEPDSSKEEASGKNDMKSLETSKEDDGTDVDDPKSAEEGSKKEELDVKVEKTESTTESTSTTTTTASTTTSEATTTISKKEKETKEIETSRDGKAIRKRFRRKTWEEMTPDERNKERRQRHVRQKEMLRRKRIRWLKKNRVLKRIKQDEKKTN